MMDAATKLRQFHSTTPVWAKEDRAVLLASADHIEAQAERIRVLREALEKLTACKAVEIRLRQLHEMGHGTDYDQHRQQFADAWVKARAALEATK